MKKIVSIILILTVCMFTLTACGVGDVGDVTYMNSQQEQQNAETQQEVDEYQANEPAKEPGLASMRTYFEYNGYVVQGSEQTVAADMIGATQGVRYGAQYGSSIFTIELYEYDINNLNDMAKTILGEADTTGSFIMLGENVPAVVSDNGKYLMIYSDTSTEQSNIDHQNQITDVFKAWL